MTDNYLFIGEKRSQTAIDNDWHWQDERLSAIQLFGALRALGIEPEDQEFLNLWDDDGGMDLCVLSYAATQMRVIALGQKVHQELEKRQIEHKTITHPAARGKIRKKENYLEHVKSVIYDHRDHPQKHNQRP